VGKRKRQIKKKMHKPTKETRLLKKKEKNALEKITQDK
jgi:hypothetical protein